MAQVCIHKAMMGLQRVMDVAASILKVLAHKCYTAQVSPLKFSGGRSLVAGETSYLRGLCLKAKLKHQYVRLLGANINLGRGYHYS